MKLTFSATHTIHENSFEPNYLISYLANWLRTFGVFTPVGIMAMPKNITNKAMTTNKTMTTPSALISQLANQITASNITGKATMLCIKILKILKKKKKNVHNTMKYGNRKGAKMKKLSKVDQKLISLCVDQFEASTFPHRTTPGAFDLLKIDSLKLQPQGLNCVQMPYSRARFDSQFFL